MSRSDPPEGKSSLCTHSYRLVTPRLTLRPMTESDWADLLRWNQDAQVLFYWDAGRTEPWSLQKLQSVYRGISRAAMMFMIDYEDRSVGEAWVQRMNLPEVLRRFPGVDLRRIDLCIGVPALWNRGLGTEAVRALVDLGFRDQPAQALFACHVARENPRSRRVFEKNGFVAWRPGSTRDQVADRSTSLHLILTRTRWQERAE